MQGKGTVMSAVSGGVVTSRTFLCGTSWQPDGTCETATSCAGRATRRHTGGATGRHTGVKTSTLKPTYVGRGRTRMTSCDWTAIRWLGMFGRLWKKRKGC